MKFEMNITFNLSSLQIFDEIKLMYMIIIKNKVSHKCMLWHYNKIVQFSHIHV